MKPRTEDKRLQRRSQLEETAKNNQNGAPVQRWDTVREESPLALSPEARLDSVRVLNQVLADTVTIRDLYKKSHWQVSGPTFYQLHLLFDKHYTEQAALVDELAERIQILGGLSYATSADFAEATKIPRPPRDRQEVPTQLSELVEAHKIIVEQLRDFVEQVEENNDEGTSDLLVSSVLRTNEMQSWFVLEHLESMRLMRAG